MNRLYIEYIRRKVDCRYSKRAFCPGRFHVHIPIIKWRSKLYIYRTFFLLYTTKWELLRKHMSSGTKHCNFATIYIYSCTAQLLTPGAQACPPVHCTTSHHLSCRWQYGNNRLAWRTLFHINLTALSGTEITCHWLLLGNKWESENETEAYLFCIYVTRNGTEKATH
jgi:hypothetical protein